MSVLKALQGAYCIDAVWAAWGDAVDARFYLGDILYDIQEALDGDFEWYCRGKLTRRGNPRHPLYMQEDTEFKWFPVSDYASYWNMRTCVMYVSKRELRNIGYRFCAGGT